MAFVLIPAVNQRPVLKLAYLCYHQLKLLFGAAWKSNIELFFFLSFSDIDTGAIHQNIYTRGVGS